MANPKEQTVSQDIKTFVIDTNVLIHRHDAILSFRDNEIIIPLWVLEELDRLKSYSDERGRNARQAVRFLDEISKQGDLNEGVRLENGSTLRVALGHAKDAAIDLEQSKTDNKILLAAYALQKEGRRVFFVSKDINARVKATALGIQAVDYEKQKVDIRSLYSGYRRIDTSSSVLKRLKEKHSVEWKDQLTPNEFIMFHDAKEGTSSIGRYRPATQKVHYVNVRAPRICGINGCCV